MCLWSLQDNFAVQSFERGIAAKDAGAFSWEIVPVEVSGGRGRPSTIVDKDEGLGKVITTYFYVSQTPIQIFVLVQYKLQ